MVQYMSDPLMHLHKMSGWHFQIDQAAVIMNNNKNPSNMNADLPSY